jgi:3-phenylpropionate/cinnamic acid dioxygenase small subunit
MQTVDGSIHTPHYIDDEYYQKLVSDFSGWRRADREVTDPVFRDSCRRFLDLEARFLDEIRLEDWLKLYAPNCVYWVPSSAEGADPRKEVSISFDDRRRLEDRIFRLSTGAAWSQRPTSRTVRLISNIEVYATDQLEIVMVRSNFQTTEFRAGETRLWSGRYSHRLRDVGNEFEILVKQVNLINYDQNLRNPSIIL